MTTERKRQANSRNSRKSTGPRSATGKSIASRNALRHGLAALSHRPCGATLEADAFARALCGVKADTQLFAQAMRIAENAMVLRVIRERRTTAVERLRDVGEVALAEREDVLKSARSVFREAKRTCAEIEAALPPILAKYRDQLGPAHGERYESFLGDIVPRGLKFLMEEPGSLEEEERLRELARGEVEQRDECEAVEAAVQDLVRIERYERRA